METNNEIITKSNLKYLSKFQNPFLTKLLTTLESDVPLDPIKIKHRLLQSTPEKEEQPTKVLKL